jgi:hypothetical protein
MKLLAYVIVLASTLAAQQPGWFSDREYQNVHVTFEYRLARWAEASFVLRTPQIGRPVQQGVAVFLAHDFHAKPGLYTTGAVAGLKAPHKLLPPTFNVWHTVDLTLKGNELTLQHDGELLQQATLPIQKTGKGYLHFADLQHKYEVRNFKASDLGDTATFIDKWQPWRLRDAGTWQTGSNSATGSNGHGINYASPLLKDFLFSAEIKATANANGGIFFRGNADKGSLRGFEIQVYSPLDSVYPTGSIYGLERSSISTPTADRWFYLQVLATGAECRVWVDGVEVAHTTNLPSSLLTGQIGLQIHMENSEVTYRALRALKL